jgi:hypothetical protein
LLDQNEHLREQTQRVLEYIRALDQHYGSEIAEHDPELGRALSDAAATLDQILRRSASQARLDYRPPPVLLRIRAS